MYIYKTTNLINGRIYIGLCRKAINESTKYYGSGIKILNAIRKHGKVNFKKEILESNIEDSVLLSKREKYWIAKYHSTDKKLGYNMSTGGTGGDTLANHPDREAIIAKRNASIRKAHLNPDYAKKQSKSGKATWACPEFRARQSAILKKSMNTPEYKQKLSDRMVERYKDPAARNKLAEAGKKSWACPKARAKRSGKKWYYNPDTKATILTNDTMTDPWVRGRGGKGRSK